jgi:hypothetical protein
MDAPPLVEPVPEGKGWTRGHRDWRPRVSLRDVDRTRLWSVYQGSGMSEAACLRQLVQEAIAQRLEKVSAHGG